jgi:nitrate/TMAO reductase-like tetraheme cytochrome c subunit
VAAFGAALTTVSAVLFLVLLVFDFLGLLRNPYFGLLVFVVVPEAFVLGLILIPVGVRLGRRRAADDTKWPVVDLNIRRQRTVIATVLILTVVNLVLLSTAAFGALHYMETTQFCGLVCHRTMEPEFVAHQNGPHARVPCVACHVGEGVEALVESKLAGTRQLWHVVTNRVPRPVPTPVRTLRPARETCEQCHWPEKLHGDELRVFREYAEDEGNTETATTLTLFVGGGSAKLGIGSGIHWHMNLENEIEYITTDPKREVIPYVRLRAPDGSVREYTTPGTTPEQLARGQRRRMDCMDCHSRPAHALSPSAERALNEAIGLGRIPRELPFVRREALAALVAPYPDKQAALAGIAARLRDFYSTRPAIDARLLERAIAGTQDVWGRNVFPEMHVSWGTYPNQISHIDTPGCFRCHDDEHTTRDGRVIKQDCEMCHKEQEQPAEEQPK